MFSFVPCIEIEPQIMPLPKTIDEVISQMDTIMEQCIAQKNPLGLFAALYQKVTIRVKEGIENGRFEDGPRMERLDVIFANRYIEAYEKYNAGQPTTFSWKAVFDAASTKNLILVQHLFMGMNAHINLDLGISTAETSPGDSIGAIKNDFLEINQLLFELLDEVQQEISKVSPLFGLIDRFAKKKDEQFAEFSMKAARKHAWVVAQRMAFVKEEDRAAAIESTDKYVVELNDLILNPGRLITFVSWIVRLFESKDIVRNIEALRVKNS